MISIMCDQELHCTLILKYLSDTFQTITITSFICIKNTLNVTNLQPVCFVVGVAGIEFIFVY